MGEPASATVQELAEHPLTEVILAGATAKPHCQVITILISLTFQLPYHLSSFLVKGKRFTLFLFSPLFPGGVICYR